ncbi:type II toxin-antitoxin system VapC family toxin [Desulfobacterales bacterium HSG2]|nr:type II toxin-antitoxin system VapC family toxin [Desulfobacterales bacterium HSG2]
MFAVSTVRMMIRPRTGSVWNPRLSSRYRGIWNSEEWSLISSGVVSYEISRTSDEERKRRLHSLVYGASEFIPVGQETYVRAGELQHQLGIRAYDALHIACAEQGGADVFLSTDDRLVKAAKRNSEATNVRVENPLIWLQEVI